MAYPSTLSSVDGTTLLATADHAAMHNAVETVIGTTAGTSVLKNFAAGNFPARINATNVLQQRVSGTVDTAVLGTPNISAGTWTSGTINSAVVGTPTITGAAINSSTIGTVKINQGSDATGDLYYRNAAGAFTRLAVGTNGQYLSTDGTVPAWTTTSPDVLNSGCLVTLSANGTIPGTAVTKLLFNTEVYDLGDEFDTSNNNFIIGTSGKYLVGCNVFWNDIEVNRTTYVAIFYNNAAISSSYIQPGSVNYINSNIQTMVNGVAGGTIDFRVSQAGTVAHLVGGGATSSNAYIQRLL